VREGRAEHDVLRGADHVDRVVHPDEEQPAEVWNARYGQSVRVVKYIFIMCRVSAKN
jgi:hypothetical protein